MREFAGKVAVATGGASGIGLGMATKFAEATFSSAGGSMSASTRCCC